MTSYTIDSYQIYIKSNIVKIVSEDCRTFQIELDNPQEIFSNKDITFEESSNKLIINIGSRKIYIPEIINDFDFGDIQITSLKKIINDMNKTMLLMNDKIKELENDNKIIKLESTIEEIKKENELLKSYLGNNIFIDGCILPININTKYLSLMITPDNITLFDHYHMNFITYEQNGSRGYCRNFYKNTFTSYHCINVYYPLIKDMKEYSNNFYRISANFNDNKDIILDYEFRFVNSLNGLENCKNIEHLQIIKQSKPDIFNSSVCNCNTIGKNINYLKTLNKLSLCCICNKDTELFNYKINDTIKTIEFIDCNNHLTDISFLKYFTSLDKIIIIDSYISSNISSFDFLLDINKKINIEIGYNGYDSSDKPWRITPIDNHNEILALQHKKNIYDKYIK